MQESLMPPERLNVTGQRLNDPRLVVNVHEGDQKRIGPKGRRKGTLRDDAILVGLKDRDLKPTRTESLDRFNDGLMLLSRGYQVAFTLALAMRSKPQNRHVVGFGSTAGEDYLIIVGPQQISHSSPGPSYRSFCLGSILVGTTARITELAL